MLTFFETLWIVVPHETACCLLCAWAGTAIFVQKFAWHLFRWKDMTTGTKHGMFTVGAHGSRIQPPTPVRPGLLPRFLCQADVSSARERARHIGAVLGPGTRALIAQMRATTQHDQANSGGGGGGDGDPPGAGESAIRAPRDRTTAWSCRREGVQYLLFCRGGTVPCFCSGATVPCVCENGTVLRYFLRGGTVPFFVERVQYLMFVKGVQYYFSFAERRYDT